MEDRLAVAEADLRLRGMHIDIDGVGRQFDEEKPDGISAGHDQAAIRFLHGVAERTIADPPAVDEEILEFGVAALAGGVGDIAGQPRRALHLLDLVQLVGDLPAETEMQAFEKSRAAGYFQHVFSMMPQDEIDVGMRESDAGD